MSKVAVKNLFGTPLNCSWTILKRKYDHVFLIKCIFRRWKGWFWSINWILLWSGGWMHVSWHVDNLLQNFIFQNCNFKINLVKKIFINFNEIFRFWVKYFKLNGNFSWDIILVFVIQITVRRIYKLYYTNNELQFILWNYLNDVIIKKKKL